MSTTIFTWDMFKFGNYFGVGHASMHVRSPEGNIYISFWPAEHAVGEALYSTGKVHFMRGDKDEDGTPSWASKPLENLNEKKIIEFWKGFDPSAELDYKGVNSKNITKPNEGGNKYNILFSQCSTVVVGALLTGADMNTRLKICAWLAKNAGTNIDFAGIKSLSKTFQPSGYRQLHLQMFAN